MPRRIPPLLSFTVAAILVGGWLAAAARPPLRARAQPLDSNQVMVGDIPCEEPPTAPPGLRYTISRTTLTLSWDPSPGAILGYVIESGSAPGLSDVAQVDTRSAATSHDTAAPAGTYYVRVRGRNACGTSSPSAEVVIAGCALASSTVIPAIETQSAWDDKYERAIGDAIPGPLNGAADYAWHGHYWLRAYVSMAKTYGDTKYLDQAVRMIDYWFARSDTNQGWWSGNSAQTMLDTGIIAQAVTIFSYAVWSDGRFAAYRDKADSYLAQLEPMLHTYDAQWVDRVTEFAGAPSFWRYATCNGLCGRSALLMYNQGATMAKALLLIDRVYRLKGLTPDPDYVRKADAAAAYFKTFVRQRGDAYVWNYGGARTDSVSVRTEDTSHAHVDLSLLITARQFGLGGLTDVDMHRLAGTMRVVLNDGAGLNNVWKIIDGTQPADGPWDRVSVGYDWIELADYDPTLFDKTVKVFNQYLTDERGSRFFLGWAEIQRKRNCTGL
jgi:hypothetical protein